MELTAIFFSIAVLILVGMYLYAPFRERRARQVTEEEHELSALMAERDRVINSLQELDFDFKLGKIPEEDYPVQRADLLQKGAAIMRKLDTLAPASPGGSWDRRGGQEAEARLEEAIAARRADGSTAKAEVTDDDLEALIAARRRVRKEKSAGFCPKCGKPVMVTDRFCPSCGKSLA
ncbi:MAG TPA: zinc ribbon domain-containing protein [Anaerolineales bacterium]|nr:zinc ribbon domain-containing protein [Anaerolineales bacterium]